MWAEILGSFGEFLIEALVRTLLSGPRWARIGCTTILAAIVFGLLAWALWPWK